MPEKSGLPSAVRGIEPAEEAGEREQEMRAAEIRNRPRRTQAWRRKSIPHCNSGRLSSLFPCAICVNAFLRTLGQPRAQYTVRMSKPIVAAESLVSLGATERRLDEYANYEITLGSLRVSRALPVKGRRMIGPWCFLDRFGPLSFNEGMPMDVAPHPHMGLQTVTWLLEGEVVHDDSLGEEAVLRPGGVNVMTSGHAIAHAERTPADNTGRLNGVQLWTALP